MDTIILWGIKLLQLYFMTKSYNNYQAFILGIPHHLDYDCKGLITIKYVPSQYTKNI